VNESRVIVSGNVATEPHLTTTSQGVPVVRFRLASTASYFDKASETWVDRSTSFYSVSCFRSLAINVEECVGMGDPVVVYGAPAVRDWEKDGRTGTSAEIEASFVGHDLARGTSKFRRRSRVQELAEAEAVAAARGAGTDDVPPGVDPQTGEVLDEADAVPVG
jgi:single-strand DNA-binding protein